MIYIFTWNSEFLLDEAILKWKNQFMQKYSEFNFTHFKDNLDINILKENILSFWLFNEKKLTIIELNNDLKEDFEENFLKILENKDENTILILKFFNPDKRKKFYKNLIKLGELKEFNIWDELDTKKLILAKYNQKIDQNALNLLIKYKSNNFAKIVNELDKLFITCDFVTENDVKQNIIPELEESIFQIIDLLLNKDKTWSIEKIHILLNDTNIFAFYNNLLANLRTNLFILKLKNDKVSQNEITKILALWNRSFLVNKSYKITYNELRDFYINLVNIDKNMKTWKLVSSEENDILNEIEKCIVKM